VGRPTTAGKKAYRGARGARLDATAQVVALCKFKKDAFGRFHVTDDVEELWRRSALRL
jgi:hypothetical protein